ncbi:MAG: hypothetical protein AAGB00_03270 [Planctomycetota bacterium]
MTPRIANPFGRRLLVLAAVVLMSSQAGAVDSRYWTLTPYRVRVLVAVEAESVPSARLASAIAEHIEQRATASIGPIWDLTVEGLSGVERLEALRGHKPGRLLEMAAGEVRGADKLIVLAVRESLTGLSATAVEADSLLERVGQPLATPPAELHGIAERCFGLLVDAFSPVALFQLEKNPDPRFGDAFVTLTYRGSSLPARPGAPDWGRPGDILLPVLRRTNREGELVEDGIRVAPWTFLRQVEAATAEPVTSAGVSVGVGEEAGGDAEGDPETGATNAGEADRPSPRAAIYSHTKRPFGIRRRGRVEYYGIVLRNTGVTTRIHLHVRDKPDQPLSGYQAYVQDGDDAERVLVGATDADGLITIDPGDAAVPMVYIKSGSQLVAKSPAPVGAVAQIDIPLLDERSRLQAEAKLSLLKDEVFDLIARRSILAARIRNAIDQGDKDNARKLLAVLDGMPGRAQFSQKLQRTQQQAKSDDPLVQKRIDKLFGDTAIVIGAFLGTSEVDKLRREIDGAP